MGNNQPRAQSPPRKLDASAGIGDLSGDDEASILSDNISANKSCSKVKYRAPPGTLASRARAVQSPEIMQWLKGYVITGGPRPDQGMAHASFASKGWEEKWPLHHASMSGDIKQIRHLILRKKMDPNTLMTDWYRSQPLGWAASCGQLAAVIELIKLGADPLLPPNDAGNTPLMDAEHEGCQHVVKFLVEFEKKIRKYIHKNAELEEEEVEPSGFTFLFCG